MPAPYIVRSRPVSCVPHASNSRGTGVMTPSRSVKPVFTAKKIQITSDTQRATCDGMVSASA